MIATAGAGLLLSCGPEKQSVVAPFPAKATEHAPTRPCSSRVEVTSSLGPPRQRIDVAIGPVYFAGLARVTRMMADEFTPRAGKRYVEAKAPLVIRAGAAVTISIIAPRGEQAGLAYAKPAPDTPPFTIANGGRAVTFRPCKPSQPRFTDDGQVGRQTIFSGGFLIRGSTCVVIRIHTQDGRRYRERVPFGAGACDSSPTHEDARSR